ncbi:MAG TPA: 50S ribosomal protein L11 methyltransferase [Pseudolabrys sp.]|nr:50S ribosomal protein L11 methyltransferase [Pseudolabrys sp.]
MNSLTTVARLVCDEQTARRLAAYLGETLDGEDAACAAFEDSAGGWQVAIHFRQPPDEASLRSLVAVAAGDAASRSLSIEPVAATDWVAQSLADLKPVRVGRFLVHGAHDRSKLRANDIGIEIEAALAFGTGHHGTTRGCLQAFADLAKRLRFQRVLDVGTGSGILAIAAARLLRARITASDIDGRAIETARGNARINRAAPLLAFVCASGATTRAITSAAPYRLIFANILLVTLVRLAVPLRGLTAPGARIVLSGLLPNHANAALAIYRAQGFVLEKRITLDGWVTLVVHRKAKPPRAGKPGRFRR